MKDQRFYYRAFMLLIFCAFNTSLWTQQTPTATQDKKDDKPAVNTKKEETAEPEEKGWNIWDQIMGEITIKGAGISGEKHASRYLEYRDVPAFQVPDIRIQKKRNVDDNFFFRMEAKDAGQDDQQINLEYSEWGEYGDYKFFFTWDRIPHRFGFSGSTLYSGIGGSTLRLADRMQSDIQSAANVTNAADRLRSYVAEGSNKLDSVDDVMLLRDKLGFGFDWLTWDPLRVSVGVEYEERNGIRPMGAAFGLPSAVELMEPVDYTTLNFKLAITYAQDAFDMGFTYAFGLFRNHDDTLTFDNPYRKDDLDPPGQPSFIGKTFNGGPEQGRLALESDNSTHRIAFKAGYNISPSTRIKGEAQWGWNASDVDLLPYTTHRNLRNPIPPVNPTVTSSLPDRGSFNGDVFTQYYQVSLTTEPLERFDAKIFTRYYQFDDNRQEINFPGYVTTDMSWRNIPIENELFDYSQWASGVNGTYRIKELNTKVKSSYQYEWWNRLHRDVEDTREHFVSLEAETVWSKMIKTSVGGGLAWRDGDRYKPNNPTEYPDFRRFDQSDRERMLASAEVGITPLPWEDIFLKSIAANIRYRFSRDDYNVTYGLRDVEWHNIGLDMDILTEGNFSLGVFFSYDRFNTEQKTRQTTLTGTTLISYPDSDWTADIKEDVYTLGIRPKWDIVNNKLTLSAQYFYTWNDSRVDLESPVGAAATDLNAYVPPDLRRAENSNRHTFNLELAYKLNPNVRFFAGYEFELFNYGNFYNDGYIVVTTPVSAGNRGAYLTRTIYEDAKVHIGYAGFNLTF